MKKTKTKEYDFFELLDNFIIDLETGKHLLKNGSRMKISSINNYKYFRVLMTKYCRQKSLDLKIYNLIRCSQKEYLKELNKWKKFYKKFSKYLYNECNYYDNYVGANMKYIRSFFNYLKAEKGIDTRDIPKIFYVSKEEVPIVVLTREQLNFLIFDKSFEQSLPVRLQRVKDIFVFGCTVGLRISDLNLLTKANLESTFGDIYLKVLSKKTGTFSRVKLPDFAIAILNKYNNRNINLLPMLHLFNFNKYIRELAELAGWTQLVDKKRSKRGQTKILRRANTKLRFRFCDLISSHTMRRTAITTYLSLGMPEQLVRRLSGHSSSSKEFYRYVKYSEEHFDNELNKVHQKLVELR
ncbi:MAG TPA: tyrosine-type recombinase/integrase [Bacteroidia bacterium]|nr:tyrosine-type recombinase/integrase [Bacteroidia bacterium]